MPRTNDYIPSISYVDSLIQQGGYWGAFHELRFGTMRTTTALSLWLLWVASRMRSHWANAQ